MQPPRPFFRRAEQDCLGGDAVIAAKILADAFVAENNDIGRGPLALLGSGPILQVPGPAEVIINGGVLFRRGRENVLERLQIGRRGGQPGQIDQLPQGGVVDFVVLVKTAVTAVLANQVFQFHDMTFLLGIKFS